MAAMTPRIASCIPLIAIALATSPAPAQRAALDLGEGTNMAVALDPQSGEIALDLQGTIWLQGAAEEPARQLTDGLGDDRQPAWSPDGRQLVFQSYRDGNWHIWRVDRDGDGLEQLTRGPHDNREPSFSPDGREVVFSSDRSGNYDIWQLQVESGRLHQLTHDPANDWSPSLAPDGTRLAFASDRAPRGIWLLVEPANESSSPTLLAETAGAAAGVVWDPSGRRVSYQVALPAEGATKLQLATAAGGAIRTLSTAGEDVFPFRAAWRTPAELLYTADGRIRTLSLADDERGEQAFLARLQVNRGFYPRKRHDLDGTAPRPLRGLRSPAVSPDGQRVVFAALGDLWIREPGGSLTRLTDDAWIEAFPRWSPDGESLVFAADRDGTMDLWTREIATGVERKLLEQAGGAAYPVFSPDGTRVAFFAGMPGNPLAARLSVLDIESGELSAVRARPAPATEISWTGDSRHVAATVLDASSSRFREGAYTLRLIPIAGGEERPLQLLDEPHSLAHATYSPDGRRLAFVADGTLSVVDVAADGSPVGDARAVSDDLADWPTWAGDSRTLVYLSNGSLRRLDLSREWSDSLPITATWSAAPAPPPLVVHAGRLFDGATAGYRENVDIVIENGRIEGVEPHSAARHGSSWIDAGEHVVMPGLFEMHAHQNATLGERLGRTWLAFGVTSVRDPGGDAYDALERKEAWSAGRRIGPRAFFTGRLLDGGRVYYSVAEGTASFEHLAKSIERAQKLDYDLLKTYVRLPDEVQRRVAGLAHDLGIPVSSHEIYPAAAYGVDGVEHLGGTSRRGYSPKITALGRSYDDVVQIIAGSGINITPTLVLPCYFLQVSNHPELLENRQYQAFYGGASARSGFGGGASLGARCGAMGDTIRRIVAAGGRVTAGTDSPFVPYGFGLQVEIQLLVASGLEPWQALRSATLWAAEAVGVGELLGSIEAGKLADLVIVDGDPLSSVEDTLSVVTTIKGGRPYPIEELLAAER
jgi:Tol biopolymer transport system component/cytosine/adenosine deaminase-related metal-dependent hydrolase